MWKIALGLFLAAHGLIHLGYVTPAPTDDPRYPFNLSKSWLITGVGLDEPVVRSIGVALSVLTVVGFTLTGLAAIGIIVPQAWWLPLAVASSIASLLLLLLFWHTGTLSRDYRTDSHERHPFTG
jgi:hypothetical protein